MYNYWIYHYARLLLKLLVVPLYNCASLIVYSRRYERCLSHAQRFHNFHKLSETDPSDLSRLISDSVLEEYVEFFRVAFGYTQE